MTKHDYFHSTPADVDLFIDEKSKERKEQSELHDYLAWLNGVYVMKAVAAVLNGRKSRYPKEPLSQSKSDVIVATEDMSEEQKAVLTDQLFANLEEMQHQFELTHTTQTGDGE